MNVPLTNAGNFKRYVDNPILGSNLMRFDFRYGDGLLPLDVSGRLAVETLLPTSVGKSIDTERTIIDALEIPLHFHKSPLRQIL